MRNASAQYGRHCRVDPARRAVARIAARTALSWRPRVPRLRGTRVLAGRRRAADREPRNEIRDAAAQSRHADGRPHRWRSLCADGYADQGVRHPDPRTGRRRAARAARPGRRRPHRRTTARRRRDRRRTGMAGAAAPPRPDRSVVSRLTPQPWPPPAAESFKPNRSTCHADFQYPAVRRPHRRTEARIRRSNHARHVRDARLRAGLGRHYSHRREEGELGDGREAVERRGLTNAASAPAEPAGQYALELR
ncbi:hypothetical protein EMIT0111MI5_30062 [Burkholderia sp. IT-111MI5]